MKGTKDDLYLSEQKCILLKLLFEIGVSRSNLSVSRDYLMSDDVVSKVRVMRDDIWKYYKTGGWNSCKYGKNCELNIIKNICKHHGIKIYKIEKKRLDGLTIRSYKIYDFNITGDLLEELK